MHLSVCHASIISINLGVSKLLALYHNAVVFQLTKRVNQWRALAPARRFRTAHLYTSGARFRTSYFRTAHPHPHLCTRKTFLW